MEMVLTKYEMISQVWMVAKVSNLKMIAQARKKIRLSKMMGAVSVPNAGDAAIRFNPYTTL